MSGRSTHKVVAIALAVALPLVIVGQTVAVEPMATDTVTTGHTNWLDASTTYDSCFAGVAGLLKQRVTWFNGQTLFSQAASGSGKYIYLMESLEADDGAYNESTGIEVKDPSSEHLVRTDNTYTFDDPEPNNAKDEWTVKEYYSAREKKGVEAGTGGDDGVGAEAGPARQVERVYVWVVQVHPDALPASEPLDRDYNFVGLVDTCKFSGDRDDNTTHDNQDPNGPEPEGQHSTDNEEGTHDHDIYSIDIWVGPEPQVVPGTEEAGGVPEERSDGGGSDDGGGSS